MTLTIPSVTDFTALTSQPALPGAVEPSARHELPLPTRIQFSYNTRFVAERVDAAPTDFHLLAGTGVTPQAGDVVIARVRTIRNHKRIETETSRKAILYEGAIVAVAYGHRYAADQFLAHVPDGLEPCHLVAAGGVAGTVTECHSKISGPTEIEPLGLLSTSTGPVNLVDFAPYTTFNPTSAPSDRPEVMAVLGTSMNSGKSTVQSCLVNGLSKAGYKVGAAKITGTGAGNDRMHYFDAGANEVLDFTDFGYSTTFKLDFDTIRALTVSMIEVLSRDNDIILIEIADGIYQDETARLLRDDLFQASVDRVAFAAVDALGAFAGVGSLHDAGLDVSFVSGVVTSSPLATSEASAVLAQHDVPVVGTFDLTDAEVAHRVSIG